MTKLNRILFTYTLASVSFFPVYLCPETVQDETDHHAKRVFAHLLIEDPASAVEEAKIALNKHPQSAALWDAYIKALAHAGDEKEMLRAWRIYTSLDPKAYEKRELLEVMSWAVIQEGARSSSPVVRVMSLLAAYFGDDYKGVDIIVDKLNDRNSAIRMVAMEVASKMRDAPICDKVMEVFRTEQAWNVRLASIQTIGAMKIKKARGDLLKIVGDSRSSSEEIAVAVEALVQLLDQPRLQEIQKLAQSERIGLRLLACELVANFEFVEGIKEIINLAKDSHYEVRAAALLTLGVLRPQSEEESVDAIIRVAKENVSDADDRVAITAAWLLTLYNPLEGQNHFKSLLNSSIKNTRLLAAAALVSCGKYAMPLLLDAFRGHPDPNVKLNLAVGLVGQRVQVADACDLIYSGLVNSTEKWMWLDFGIYHAVAPSTVKHDDLIPNKPEAVNQQVRLELLKLLAINKHAGAQPALKQLLKEKTWGISGVASIQLLSEGDEDSSDVVSSLLTDPDPLLRTQAALVLAMWGRGEDGVEVLMKAYADSDRETKEKILEGLGKIGSQSSVPFLVDRMEESCQTLRIMAAAAIIQALYH